MKDVSAEKEGPILDYVQKVALFYAQNIKKSLKEHEATAAKAGEKFINKFNDMALEELAKIIEDQMCQQMGLKENETFVDRAIEEGSGDDVFAFEISL